MVGEGLESRLVLRTGWAMQSVSIAASKMIRRLWVREDEVGERVLSKPSLWTKCSLGLFLPR